MLDLLLARCTAVSGFAAVELGNLRVALPQTSGLGSY